MNIKTVFKFILIGFLVASLLHFHIIDLKQLQKILRHPQLIIYQFIIFVVLNGILAKRWQLVMKSLGIIQNFKRTLQDQFLSNFASLFWGNTATKEIVKIASVCHRNPHQKMLAMVSVLVDRFLGLISFLLIGILASLPFWTDWGWNRSYLIPSCLIAGIGAWAMRSFLLKRVDKLAQIGEALKKFSKKKTALWLVMGLASPLLALVQILLVSPGLLNQAGVLLVIISLWTIAQTLSFLPIGMGVNQWIAFKLMAWTGMEHGAELATTTTAIQVYTLVFMVVTGVWAYFFGTSPKRQ